MDAMNSCNNVNSKIEPIDIHLVYLAIIYQCDMIMFQSVRGFPYRQPLFCFTWNFSQTTTTTIKKKKKKHQTFLITTKTRHAKL